MGMDLPDVGVFVDNIPLEATLRLTVFSVLTRCLLLGVPPPPPPAIEGVAGGNVAAVHVSVTGQSSDFTLVTPRLEVR